MAPELTNWLSPIPGEKRYSWFCFQKWETDLAINSKTDTTSKRNAFIKKIKCNSDYFHFKKKKKT